MLDQVFLSFVSSFSAAGFGGIVESRIFGLSVGNLLFALSLFVASGIALWVTKRLVVRRLRRRLARSGSDGILSEAVGFFDRVPRYALAALALYLPARFLAENAAAGRIVDTAIVCVLLVEGLRLLGRVFDRIARKSFLERDGGDRTTYHFVRIAIQVGLFVLGGLLVLANAGVEIGPLLASLGIGGIAVAFALQNILRDLFSSFCIFLDKPFVVGDSVKVWTDEGTVEKIGLRTTRLRTPAGAELSIANAEVASARVTNSTRMMKRRVVSTLSISGETPLAAARDIPELVRESVEAVEGVTFDRAHLRAATAAALEFEYVYHVHSPSSRAAAEAQERIGWTILERLEERTIRLA